MIFSVTGAGSDATRNSCDAETLKKSFVEQLKREISRHVLDEATPTDPYLSFAKIALDNEGKPFAILCSQDRFEPLRDGESLLEAGCYLELKAFTISASGLTLVPLCRLSGRMDRFFTKDPENTTYESFLATKRHTEKCYINTIASLNPHFENHGFGRELILFWQELCYEHTNLNCLGLDSINVEKNVPWYEKFGFKIDEEEYRRGDETYEEIKWRLLSTRSLISMNMELDDVCNTDLKTYFSNKKRRESQEIFNKADDETKRFVSEANEELRQYIQDLRNSMGYIDLAERRGLLKEVPEDELPFFVKPPKKKV